MTMEYIIDNSIDFTGSCQTIVIDGKIQYSECKNLAEYRKANQNLNLILLSEKEFMKKTDNYHKSICNNWVKIPESKYYEMFECLPPLLLEHNLDDKIISFFILEATTAHFHSFFVKYKGKHYTSLQSRLDKRDTIINSLKKFLEV